MTKNFDNRKRAFTDVVAIDAWHRAYGAGVSSADLHADVVFGVARVGGEAESKVRFRLSVRRAEIVVVVPESEPVVVDKASVSRDAPKLAGRVTHTRERSKNARVSGAASVALRASGSTGALSAGAESGAKVSLVEKIEISGPVTLFVVTQSQNGDGDYRWIVESASRGALVGRPWDAKKQPRLKLLDRRSDRSKGIPPAVRVEVRCRREDLLIEDIELKEQSSWAALKVRAGFKNRLAAAEAYIRSRLAEEGFEVASIEDKFAQMTLGGATAEST